MIIRKINTKIKRKIDYYKQRCNKKIKKSNWYHNLFFSLEEFENIERNSDIICIGSSPAKYAVDFHTVEGIKGSNLSVMPETIFYDYQIIKNYHSYLKPGGTVLLVICPFTFCKDKYRNENGSKIYLNIRYYPILHRALIDNFDYAIFQKYVENPLLLGKTAWKRLIKDTPKSQCLSISSNLLSDKQMFEDASKRINGWKNEFGLSDFSLKNIPDKVNKAIKENIEIYKNIKEFIKERDYNLVVVIPPFSKELSRMLPIDILNHNIFEPLNECNIKYISYLNDEKWMKRELFKDSFLMNLNGRKLLTKDILSKIYGNI